MCYTEEEIKKYLEILNNYKTAPPLRAVEDANATRKVKCWNCHNSECFFYSFRLQHL